MVCSSYGNVHNFQVITVAFKIIHYVPKADDKGIHVVFSNSKAFNVKTPLLLENRKIDIIFLQGASKNWERPVKVLKNIIHIPEHKIALNLFNHAVLLSLFIRFDLFHIRFFNVFAIHEESKNVHTTTMFMWMHREKNKTYTRQKV